MNQKFKIGDRVRIKGAFGIHKGEYLIEDLISESISYKLDYFSGSYSDINLELVQTSEQIAVEKFKEELKANVKDTINIIENSINPTNSEFKKMLRLSRLEAYEEVLKLLESEDK